MLVKITGALYRDYNDELIAITDSENGLALCVLSYFRVIDVQTMNRTSEYLIFTKNWDDVNTFFERLYSDLDGLTYEQEKNNYIQLAKSILYHVI